MMQSWVWFVFSSSKEGEIFFSFFTLCFSPSLSSDEDPDLYGNEGASHRVYKLNEALDSLSKCILAVHHLF